MKYSAKIILLLTLIFLNSSLTAQIPTTGLVAYYPFNGNANDESGNGNNGIVTEAVLSSDRFDVNSKTYDFDGVNDFIDAGNAAIFNSNNISISVWIRPESSKTGGGILGKYPVDGIYNGIGYRLVTDVTGVVDFAWSRYGTPTAPTGSGVIRSTTIAQPNQWMFITVIKNSIDGSLKMYINGILEATLTGVTAPLDNNEHFFIGKPISSPPSSDEYFRGKIDDIRVYNRVLNENEISNLYHENGYAQVTDIDGNVYNTVKIGTQEWMQENLKTTRYNEGTAIPNVTGDAEWLALTSGAYCWYNNDQATNKDTYGGLYNWYVISGNRNVCPTGWHVSTDADWKELEMHLGMSQVEADAFNYRGTHNEGGKLKEAGLIHWQSPNSGGDNSSGFTGLGGGYRYGLGDGTSYQLLHYGCFWSDNGTFRTLMSEITTVLRSDISDGSHNNYGFSIRCVKDDLNKGIVAYYPFNGNANDESGNGYNGTPAGATLTNDRKTIPGTAYSFNGVNSGISISQNSTLNNLSTSDHSITSWVKFNTLDGYQTLLRKADDGSASSGGLLVQFVKNVNFYVYHGLPTNNPSSAWNNPGVILPNLKLNKWYFLGITYSRVTNTTKFYLNGSYLGEANHGTYVPIANSDNLLIGKKVSSDADVLNGGIDEVRLYNRTLQESEIQSIYNLEDYEKIPIIYNFSPVSGLTGTTVTITGTNFDPTPANNIVRFGAVKANVLSASSMQLTVAVPVGATFQPITVTNLTTGLTAYSSKPFKVTFLSSNIIDAASFNAPVSFSAGSAPTFSAISDIDGDGKPDVIYSNAGSNTVSIRLNTGSSGTINAGSLAANYDLSTGAGTNPVGVNVGDLDGDSKPDLAVTNYSTNTVSVFRNTSTPGSLSFDARVDFATAVTPHVGNIVDVDGDGKPDIAVECYNSHVVSVLRNTSVPGSITSGSFAAKADFPVGSNPRGMATGDFNFDGKPDLAITNHFGNSISVLINTSISGVIDASSFAAKVDFTAGTQPCGITTGDIDDDGKTDILVANYGSTSISAFRNIFSTGSFTVSSLETKVDYTVGSSPMYVFLSDIDGDSKPDILVNNAGSSSISIFKNQTTSGTFTAASFSPKTDISTVVQPTGPAIGDLDGDSKPDIITANNPANTLIVLRNIVTPPIPAITSFTPTSGAVGSTVTITGTNFSTTPSENIVWFGAVKATVTTATSTQLTVTVPSGTTFQPISVIVNGLTAYSGKQFKITFNGSGAINTSTLTTPISFTSGNNPQYVSICDIDRDGKPDIIFTNSGSSTFSVLRNIATTGELSSGSFETRLDFSTGTNTNPFGITTADIDGDGMMDIVIANNATNTVSVFRNSGSPGTITFASRVDIPVGVSPFATGVTDIDSDGKPDIVVVNYNNNAFSAYKNLCTPGNITVSTFGQAIDFVVGTAPKNIFSGDIDGDGKYDIIVSNTVTNSISVFRNAGLKGLINSTSFDPVINIGTGWVPLGIVIADIDGDGKQDIFASNAGVNTLHVLRNNSSPGSFSEGSIQSNISFNTGQYPDPVNIGDLDGDGKPDAITGNTTSNTISIFKNTSVTGLLDGNSLAGKVDINSTTPKGLSLGDLDGDGKPDLVVANGNANTISVFKNSDATVQIPLAPVAIDATNKLQTGFTTNWNSSATATGYYLDLSTTNDFSSFVTGYNGKDVSNVTSYSVTGLATATTYYYRVRAYNGAGSSSNSNQITVTTLPDLPSAPVAGSATSVTQTSLYANWSASSGATGYRLDVSASNTFASFITGYNDLDVNNVTTYSITGLTANTTYYYRVRAYNTSGTSGNSNTITSPTLINVPAAPVAGAPGSVTNTGFAANWGGSPTATGYKLDISTTNTFSTFVAGYNDLDVSNVQTYLITGLTANNMYYYRVRAYNSSGPSSSSNVITAVTLPDAPSAPVADVASNYTQTTFTANWAASATATGYRLDVSTTNTFSTFISSYNDLNVSNVTSYSVTGLQPNTTYYYRVRAYNAGGTSVSSNTITAITLINPPSAPTANTATVVTQTGMTANWTATATATGYRLDVSATNDFSTYISSYNDLNVNNVTSYPITGLLQNTSYYYRVRAYNAGGTSVSSNVISQTTLPDPPEKVTPLPADQIIQTQFRANWQAAATATGYYLDVAKDIGFTNMLTGLDHLNVGNVTSYLVSGLTQNTTYYYRIISYNTGGNGLGSVSVNVTTLPDPPSTPVALTGTNITQTGFRANWNHSSTATGYKMDVATDNGFTNPVSGYNNLDVSYVNIYYVTGLNPNTDYFLRVRAYNSGGTSTNSNTITLKTLPNPPAAPTGLTAKSCNDLVTLTWTGNTEQGLLRYRIYGGQTANTTTLMDSTSSGVTTKTFTGLQHGKVYYFRVKAVLSQNVSGNYSSEANVKVKVGHIPKLILKWDEVLVCSNAADSIQKGKYQWYKDNSPLTTDFTSNQFVDTRAFPANFRSGVYKVKITDTDGCVNFSNSINVTGVKSLSLYPNPAKTEVAVSLKAEPSGDAVISIINNSGVMIRELKTDKNSENLLEEVDVSGLDEGIYYVKVVIGGQYEYYSKIVVIK